MCDYGYIDHLRAECERTDEQEREKERSTKKKEKKELLTDEQYKTLIRLLEFFIIHFESQANSSHYPVDIFRDVAIAQKNECKQILEILKNRITIKENFSEEDKKKEKLFKEWSALFEDLYKDNDTKKELIQMIKVYRIEKEMRKEFENE